MIVLTAKTDETNRAAARELGVYAYLGKPFNDQEVTDAVKKVLEVRRGELSFEETTQNYARKLLQRFLPPTLIEEVLTSGGNIDTEPKSISATILFSDLVGFTALTSKLRAVKMARILNEYLHSMNEVIFEHGVPSISSSATPSWSSSELRPPWIRNPGAKSHRVCPTHAKPWWS